MGKRFLDVTAHTTLDLVDARAEGDGWTDDAVGVVDVASPDGVDGVRLGLELDPTGTAALPHHAQYARLSPDQARTLAADLEAAADAADADETVTSRR